MAEIRDTNYWGRSPSTDAQIKLRQAPKRSIEEIISASRSGQPPTAAEIQQALAELQSQAQSNYDSTGSRKLNEQQKAQMDYLLYGVNRDASRPSLYNDPDDAFPRPGIGSGISTAFSGLAQGLKGAASTPVGNGVGAGVGGIAEGIKGIGASLFGDQGSQEESPEQLYQRLRAMAGEYNYTGPSADEMAKQEFDPQFAVLKSIAEQTQNRYNTNKKDISQMYAGLVNDQTTARGEDKAMFDQAVKGTDTRYDQAASGLTGNATNYSKAMAQELARLGVKEGMGDIVGANQQNLQDNLGRLTQQGQGTQDLLTNLGANEYAFDTRGIGTAKQAGINTQEEFLQDFMGAMTQNDQQRLALTGQQQAAENNYAMQIQKLLQEGRGSHEENILKQFQSILGANEDNEDDYYKQAGLDLQQQQFAWQQQMDQARLGQSNNKAQQNAYDVLQQRALTQYGDPSKARQAVDEILAAYQNNPNPQNIGDFLNSVDQDALRQNPEMTSLIYDFISRILQEQQKR